MGDAFGHFVGIIAGIKSANTIGNNAGLIAVDAVDLTIIVGIIVGDDVGLTNNNAIDNYVKQMVDFHC